MTLDELKKINEDASKAKGQADRYANTEKMLADRRNGDERSFAAVYERMRDNSRYGGVYTNALDAFLEVLDENMGSMLRVAELRLQAKVRSERQRERVLRAQLAAYLDEPTKQEAS